MLDHHLVGVNEGQLKALVTQHFLNLSDVQLSQSLNIEWPPLLVDTTVPLGIVLAELILLGEFKCLANIVNIVLFPIFNVVFEHRNDVVQHKLPCSAVSEEH